MGIQSGGAYLLCTPLSVVNIALALSVPSSLQYRIELWAGGGSPRWALKIREVCASNKSCGPPISTAEKMSSCPSKESLKEDNNLACRGLRQSATGTPSVRGYFDQPPCLSLMPPAEFVSPNWRVSPRGRLQVPGARQTFNVDRPHVNAFASTRIPCACFRQQRHSQLDESQRTNSFTYCDLEPMLAILGPVEPLRV